MGGLTYCNEIAIIAECIQHLEQPKEEMIVCALIYRYFAEYQGRSRPVLLIKCQLLPLLSYCAHIFKQ